jgi:hypothetical protein
VAAPKASCRTLSGDSCCSPHNIEGWCDRSAEHVTWHTAASCQTVYGCLICAATLADLPFEHQADLNRQQRIEHGVGQRSALMLLCYIAAIAREIMMWNAAESLPTYERGQAIRGHYCSGCELVVHARPCLVLLRIYLGTLPHVRHLRILGALSVDLATGRSMGRTQGLRKALTLHFAASCRRPPQHFSVIYNTCPDREQALRMLAQCMPGARHAHCCTCMCCRPSSSACAACCS